MMTRFRYKPEDFACDGVITSAHVVLTPWMAADRANQLLEKHEKTSPVVYSTGLTEYGGWSQAKSMGDSFKALLWGVEKL